MTEGASSQKPAGDDATAVTSLSFPPIGSDPLSQLHYLQDNTSSYAHVAKTCLLLTQYAGCQSSASSEDTTCIASSSLFHDATYVDIVRASLAALMDCLLGQHADRRCRILAGKTLAILARSAYARIRPSPLLFASRDARVSGLEDEVGAEVATALATAVLDDPDDGVSACAMEAMGMMLLTNSPTIGTVVEDELLTELQSIGFARPSAYAPSLRSLVDEDPSIPHMELATRVLDNIMAPRLIQMVDRIALYKSTSLVCLTLPTLTASLVHQVKTTPSLLSTMDRSTYAKRWTEVDATGLVDAVLTGIVLPILQSSIGQGSLAACQSALRLAHVCPTRSWVPVVCQASVHTLLQELAVLMDTEQKIGLLALLIVASKGIPLIERTEAMIAAANLVATLPSTTQAPFGVSSPGALMNMHGYKCYRRPARTGLWTEIALSFFMDGPNVEEGSSSMQRHEGLQEFFTSPPMTKIISIENRSTVLPLFDELLLVFSSVAVESGRRFLVSADGSPLLPSSDSTEVKTWLKLSWTVLKAFVPCVTLGQTSLYLEENLTLLTAGGASYTRLVQMYLYTIGLIPGNFSVAFKLAASACPPHLLWDPLSESASFSYRYGAAESIDVDGALKLVEEFVVRETKQGLASHHMRMFLLTLAADTWIESRMWCIHKHQQRGAPLSLKVNTAREIVMALGPKRLIAKIYEGHSAPAEVDGKKKKDPVRILAKEAVRASVAAIENVALVACSWRRRFGQNQEAKHLVSIAVGLLQGKVDETPLDDLMRSIMGPLCEAAVARIQSEYQDDGSVTATDPFPVSDLVTQPIKPKIKPLVSNAKPSALDPEKSILGHLMQLCRQVIVARTEKCILSLPSLDSSLSTTRPVSWLRLAVPPQLPSKDGRCLGNHCSPFDLWGKSVALSSAASDAIALVTAYTPRRYLRCDGEEEYRVTILVRAFNITPVELPEGIKLMLGIVRPSNEVDDADGNVANDFLVTLGGAEDLKAQRHLSSAASVYRQEVKSGEQLSWEVSLDTRSSVLNAIILPSVVYRNIMAEPEEVGAKWSGEGLVPHGDGSTATGGESKSGEDDFQVKPKSNETSGTNEKENAVLSGEPLALSPLSDLQPCPLVFFCNCWGDIATFRLFWFSMPFRLAQVKVVASREMASTSAADRKVADMSSLRWDGEAIPGGFATKLWAFMAMNGSRVLCCLVENDNGRNLPDLAVHFRGNDRQALYSLTASEAARRTVVAALCPGLAPVD